MVYNGVYIYYLWKPPNIRCLFRCQFFSARTRPLLSLNLSFSMPSAGMFAEVRIHTYQIHEMWNKDDA